MRQANGLGCVFRGAFTTRRLSRDAKGEGAPSGQRVKLALSFAMALVVALVLGVTLATAAESVFTIEDATNVTRTTADVKGTVDPGTNAAYWTFEYIADAKFEENLADSLPGFAGASPGPSGLSQIAVGAETVEGQLTGLVPGTTYHLRLRDNDGGPGEAVAANTFTTEPLAKPIITVPVASEVGYSTAHFAAEVTPGGEEEIFNTSCRFEYVSDAKFQQATNGGFAEAGSVDCNPNPVTGSGATEVTANLGINSLQANTLHHLRLVAGNAGGVNISQTEAPYPTFETKEVAAPEVTIAAVTDVTDSSATFSGTVNPNAPEEAALLDEAEKEAYRTSWHFECTPGCDGGSGEFSADNSTLNSAEPVSYNSTGLQPATSYTIRLIAKNAGGPNIVLAEDSFETDALPPDQVTDSPTLNPTQTTATVVAGVNPHNSPLTDCRFVYGIGSATGSEEPCAGPDEVQQVSYQASAGQFRLSFAGDTTGDLPFNASAGEVQAALEGLPSIGLSAVAVTRVGDSQVDHLFTIRFQGSLSAQSVEQIEIEDGTQPIPLSSGEYGVSTQTQGAPLPASPQGNGPMGVIARLSGLAPGSDYHFKLVVTTAAGTVEGDEQTFPTFPETETEPTCPNEVIREAQDVRAPECRAYEMTTPVDKNGADAPAGNDNSVKVSADGNGVSYYSRAGFADTTGSGNTGFSHYIARRGPEGWSSHAITPETSPQAVQILVGGTRPLFFSEDLRKAVVLAYDLPGANDDLASDVNVYSQDTDTRAVQAITRPLDSDQKYFSFIGDPPMAASSDTSHMAFSARGFAGIFSADAAPGVENAYEWDNGVLRLAGILPNGSVPAQGSALPGDGLHSYRPAVSDDGSRITFFSPAYGERQIYVRRNHTDTVWVSEPETSAPPSVQKADLQWISPSGKHILFSTSSALVDEDSDEGTDLYLYTDGPNPTNETNLTMITKGSGYGGSVIGANEEATRIFVFNSSNAEIFFFSEGERKLVAGHVLEAGQYLSGLSAFASSPGGARVSADGKRLAFMNEGKMSLYDGVADTLTVVSSAGVTIEPAENDAYPQVTVMDSRPNFLSSSGRRLFFSTTQSLVPSDTNGAADAYLYDTATGERSLVSPGDTSGGAWFQNASLSGDDVFVVTRDRLLEADEDGQLDLYDARINGGFAPPPPAPAPCSGDGCRGSVSAPPAVASPATPNFSGPGNRRCKQKGSKQGKSRCRLKKAPQKKAHKRKRAMHAKQGGGR
jgi:Tol biopolymer transport system component